MFPRRLHLLACALPLVLAPALHAQVQVQLKLERHLYLSYEPIVATVSITNLTGRDLTLADEPPEKWFGFEITDGQDDPIPPRAPNYHVDPLTVPTGQTLKRKVNLVNLYPITDYGVYHVRAAIYVAPLHRYVSSNPIPIEVTEGKTLWQQTVGIPDGQKNAGQFHTYEVLSFRQPEATVLYVRVEDKDGNTMYGTYQVGRLINGYDPQIELDASNQLNVLQMVEPKSYYCTRIGPNGEWLGQDAYIETKTRPHLKKTAEGDVVVAGGQTVTERAAGAPLEIHGPKLSDRPAGMPGQ